MNLEFEFEKVQESVIELEFEFEKVQESVIELADGEQETEPE